MKKLKWFVAMSVIVGILTGCSTLNEGAEAVAASAKTSGSPVSMASEKGANLEWAFTQEDQHPEKLLIKVIDSSQKKLDIAIYSLTHPDIVKAIKDAKNRGVQVRIISDETQSGGKTQKEAFKILMGVGIPIKINEHSGLMHEKVTIADEKVVTTGSFNYSKAASTNNDEILMVLHDPDVAKSFDENFQHMWDNKKGFKDYQ